MLTDKFFIYSELLDEIFRKDVTYDNIKSRRKPWFHPPFRKQIFRKTTEESQIDTPPPPNSPPCTPPSPYRHRFRVKILFKSSKQNASIS